MNVVTRLQGPVWLFGLVVLLEGCGRAPVAIDRSASEAVRATDRTPASAQWVRFGLVEWVSPTSLEGGGGGTEAAMELSIRFDNGEEIRVAQAVSQAGQFNVGDRVRLLQIGEFTRVTFWPYDSAQGALRVPSEGAE